MLLFAFKLGFVFLVSWGAISDYQMLKIPNRISLLLCGVFLVFALLFLGWADFTAHLITGVSVFALAIGLYALGWFGGGDVKLLGAVALWAGPDQVYELVVLIGLIGGMLGALLLGLRILLRRCPTLWGPAPLARILRWAKDGVCPYGLAIGSAALLCVPKMFS